MNYSLRAYDSSCVLSCLALVCRLPVPTPKSAKERENMGANSSELEKVKSRELSEEELR